jgi:hypothetical protein
MQNVDDAYAYGNEPIELEFELRPIDCSSHASSSYESRGFFPRKIELDRSGPMRPDVNCLLYRAKWMMSGGRRPNVMPTMPTRLASDMDLGR